MSEGESEFGDVEAAVRDVSAPDSDIDESASSEDWIDSVDELEGKSGPVDSRDFNPDIDHLGNEDIDFLDGQTKRTLDRHAVVQDDQRQQAKHILRAMILISGVIIAVAPFASSFIQSITFASSVPSWRAVLSLFLLLVSMALIEFIAIDVLEMTNATFHILSPEKTERGIVGSILAIGLNIFKTSPKDEESGGGVRSVSILDELAPVIDDPVKGMKEEIIVNRLNRIRRNERVVNENSQKLHEIYQRAKLALERIVMIAFLLAISFMLLGAEI